ncbi:MFS transporter [Chondrinema litorale]|uniref:MFS transporter n=1 Tax=Chondrinema litorale TaxID=2994555 RepID=UPI0025431F3C|nr:MFS transporter [Chondrinema litorale]UZR98519.1 MFS transporter [Chondrinema litorale]
MKIPQLSKGLLFIMTVTTGLVVANIYYNQPLLGLMANTYGVSELNISSIPMFTQVGYALGLFLIVPLGDKLKRKKLVLIDFIFIIISLLAAAVSSTPLQLKIASLFIGLTSVVPQIMVPMAAQLASNEKRGAAIGTIMTGLFIGILGSRTLSGLIGSYLNWQAVYLIAAGIMVILFFFLIKFLPELNPDFQGNYLSLLKSIVKQFQNQPKLRVASIRGLINFSGFSIFWTTLVFLLQESPFYMGSDVTGGIGLVGIAGAITASVVGSLNDKVSKNKLIFSASGVTILSWVILGFSSASLMGIIIGAFLLDVGVQSIHITNQTIIFDGNPDSRNRINTVYMTMYFIGGALGTLIGGSVWHYFKWQGISIAGFVIGLLLIIVHLIGNKK